MDRKWVEYIPSISSEFIQLATTIALCTQRYMDHTETKLLGEAINNIENDVLMIYEHH